VKPNINSVEVHPQLSDIGHPVDDVLVGAGSQWPTGCILTIADGLDLFPFKISLLNITLFVNVLVFLQNEHCVAMHRDQCSGQVITYIPAGTGIVSFLENFLPAWYLYWSFFQTFLPVWSWYYGRRLIFNWYGVGYIPNVEIGTILVSHYLGPY
jgi:hypothetical protein